MNITMLTKVDGRNLKLHGRTYTRSFSTGKEQSTLECCRELDILRSTSTMAKSYIAGRNIKIGHRRIALTMKGPTSSIWRKNSCRQRRCVIVWDECITRQSRYVEVALLGGIVLAIVSDGRTTEPRTTLVTCQRDLSKYP
jgi:hypothetical protein